MITELKAGQTYKLINKEGYLSSHIANEGIYEHHFVDNLVCLPYIDALDGWGCIGDDIVISRKEYQFFEEYKSSVQAPQEAPEPLKGKNDTTVAPNVFIDLGGRTRANTAEETLEKIGYEWVGGELWKPPLGKVPDYLKEAVVYTKEMYDEGVLPEKGMTLKGEVITKAAFRLDQGGRSQVVVSFKESGNFDITTLDFPEPKSLEEVELEELIQVFHQHSPPIMSRDRILEGIQEYFHNKYDLELK